MRCALYCRVSLEEKTEKYGLASQERSVREYAKAKGYTVVEVFRDDGFLGATLERPALERMREMVRQKLVDVVVAHDTDRLSRELHHLLLIEDECERRGVAVEYVTTPEATNTPEGRMLKEIKGVFSKYERTKIRERTLRGRREKARQGKIVGGKATYGYSLQPDGTWAINEEQSAIVRQIFAWAADGISTRGIVTRLNELGVKPHTVSKWGKSTLYRILRNSTYTGTAHYYRTKRVSLDSSGRQFRSRQDWIDIAVPRIIEPELFNRVAEQLARNLEVLSGRPSQTYLLRGLLRCGKCGGSFCGCASHGVPFYRCYRRDKHNGGHEKCTAGMISARHIERAVWGAICEALLRPGFLRGIVERHIEQFAGEGKDKAREAAILRKQIATLAKKEIRAAEALIDSDLRDHWSLFKAQLQMIRSQKTEAVRALMLIERTPEIRETAARQVERLCTAAKQGLAVIEGEQKRQFVRELVEMIVLTGREVEIRCVLTTNAADRPHRVDGLGSTQPRIPFILHVDLEAAA